jgi:CBS domain-containing membrane protein
MAKIRFFFYLCVQAVWVFVFMWAVVIAFILFSDSLILSIVGLSSVAASSFIVFMKPDARYARFSNVLGGYCLGVFAGLLSHYVMMRGWVDLMHLPVMVSLGVPAALAIMVAFFLMILFRMEHPPAISMALGVAFVSQGLHSLMLVIASLLLMFAVQKVLGSRLKALD